MRPLGLNRRHWFQVVIVFIVSSSSTFGSELWLERSQGQIIFYEDAISAVRERVVQWWNVTHVTVAFSNHVIEEGIDV
jgi:hypothetical protein